VDLSVTTVAANWAGFIERAIGTAIGRGIWRQFGSERADLLRPSQPCNVKGELSAATGGILSDAVNITYRVEDCSSCDKFQLVQLVKTDRNLFPDSDWHIDSKMHGDSNEFDPPYYNPQTPAITAPNGDPIRGGMSDDPRIGSSRFGGFGVGGTQDYETCVVCVSGKDKGKVMGCHSYTVTSPVVGAPRVASGSGTFSGERPSRTFIDLMLGAP
jgi:hypothetical protein